MYGLAGRAADQRRRDVHGRLRYLAADALEGRVLLGGSRLARLLDQRRCFGAGGFEQTGALLGRVDLRSLDQGACFLLRLDGLLGQRRSLLVGLTGALLGVADPGVDGLLALVHHVEHGAVEEARQDARAG